MLDRTAREIHEKQQGTENGNLFIDFFNRSLYEWVKTEL